MSLKYLMISLLISEYETIYYLKNPNENDFDETFFDDDGNFIDDLDYFYKNFKTLNNTNNLYESVYNSLVNTKSDEFDIFNETFGKNNDAFFQNERSVKFVIATFIYNFLTYCYCSDDKKCLIFLSKMDYADIKELFFNNFAFGTYLIRTYYNSLFEHELCEDNYALMKKNGDDFIIAKWEKIICSKPAIITLNNLLRNTVCQLFEYYIQSYTINESLKFVWLYLTNEFDSLTILQNLGFSTKEIKFLKIYLLKLIIADLYEDVCNEPIIYDKDQKDMLIKKLPITYSDLIHGFCNCKERNAMLYHFILLNQDKAKMFRNREKTKKDGRINILKKANPLYFMD